MDNRESGGGGGRVEALRLLGIAERLLEARDLVGSRRFAERAMEADPIVDGADQILAVADVLLGAQRRINNHIDWYAVLGQDPSSSDFRGDPSADLRRKYRRLFLLLRPGPGPTRTRTAVSQAFSLINDAWTVFSDPSKKCLFDKEREIAALVDSNGSGSGNHHDPHRTPPQPAARTAPPPLSACSAAAFWTFCPHCCQVFQYNREYQDETLRCQICRKDFHAAEMPRPPQVVPGRDMYYCSWALIPLGFAGPDFAGATSTGFFGAERGSGAGGGSYYSVFPWWGTHPPQPFFSAVGGDGVSRTGLRSGMNLRSASERGKSNASESMLKTPQPIYVKSPRMKKKVTARKPRKQRAGVEWSGGTAEGESEVSVEEQDDVLAETGDDDAEMFSEAMQTDNESKKVGSSDNAGAIGEGVDLNFTIEIDNTTDDILENLSSIPFLKDGEIVIIN